MRRLLTAALLAVSLTAGGCGHHSDKVTIHSSCEDEVSVSVPADQIAVCDPNAPGPPPLGPTPPGWAPPEAWNLPAGTPGAGR